MPTYSLGSSPLVHGPGLVAWAINAYAFPREQAITMRVVTQTWPGFPAEHARLLLTKTQPYTVDGETVIFTVPDDADLTIPPAAQEAER